MTKKTWDELSRKKRRFWKAHIRTWGKSGLAQNEYCRQNDLKSHQFTYWKTKFNKEKPVQANFVPVNNNLVLSALDNSDSGLSVQLGQLQIRINNNFNSTCLLKVVSLLQGRP